MITNASPEQRAKYELALRARAVKSIYDLDLGNTDGPMDQYEIMRPAKHYPVGPDVFAFDEVRSRRGYGRLLGDRPTRTLEEAKRAVCAEWGLPWHEGTVTELPRQPRDYYFDSDEEGQAITRPLTDQLKIDGTDI